MPIDKKKIAKNSLALYLRMFISVGITFYTSRVILKTLGVDDFGTYNVVCGIAVMFSFLSGALSSSTVRYITYAIGKGDSKEITEVFSLSVKAHFFIGIIVVLFSEIVGLWLIYKKLSIGSVPFITANIIFQLSLLGTFFGIINVPYVASVIAEEKMTFFAYINIFESVAKLGISFLISLFPHKLTIYGFLLFILSFLVFTINRFYCIYTLKDIRFNKFVKNSGLLKEIFLFSWWNMIKYGSEIGYNQASTIFVNIWGGPIASAAMAIYTQVNSGLIKFIDSFQNAFNPQITKNWAQEDSYSFNKLIVSSSKFSLFLMLLPAIPLSIFMKQVLDVWLDTVPENTDAFCQIGLLCLWFNTMKCPMDKGIMAIGNIRNYQLISSVIWIISVPISWFLLINGMPFRYILCVRLLALISAVIYNLIYLSNRSNLNINQFLLSNFIRPLVVLLVSYAFGLYVAKNLNISLAAKLLLTTLTTSFSTILLVYVIGLNSSERKIIRGLIIK